MTTQVKIEQKKAPKTVGTRVTVKQYNYIMEYARKENLSMSTHTNLKKHKAAFKEALLNYLMNPVLLFEPEKRKRILNALSFLERYPYF